MMKSDVTDIQPVIGTTAGLKTLFKERSEETRTCIQTCMECHEVCESMIRHCLEKGGKHAEAHHLTLMRDCSQICLTAADFMMRESAFTRLCELCAEVCDACADDCETFTDDEAMKACAETCRRCADVCRTMSAKGSSPSTAPM